MARFYNKKNSIICVDELNVRLHPLLVRTLLITFLNHETNPKNAQLVLFTSHDSWQLNSNILRRDEIWFCERREDGISSLYSLAGFIEYGAKIRKNENFEKNYLLGKYGAIPELHNLDVLDGE